MKSLTERTDAAGVRHIEFEWDYEASQVLAAMLAEYGQAAWNHYEEYQRLRRERAAAEGAQRREELQRQIDAVLQGLGMLTGNGGAG